MTPEKKEAHIGQRPLAQALRLPELCLLTVLLVGLTGASSYLSWLQIAGDPSRRSPAPAAARSAAPWSVAANTGAAPDPFWAGTGAVVLLLALLGGTFVDAGRTRPERSDHPHP